MDTYIRLYDEQRKGEDDSPTIGFILCIQKNEAVAKYSFLTDSSQMFAAKYLPYLPSEAELKRELERIQEQLIHTPGPGSTMKDDPPGSQDDAE